MTTFDNNDAVYVQFRETAATTLYGNTDHDIVIDQRLRHVAARAIKSILELTRPTLQNQPWYDALVKDAADNGFEIHPGKGVTFADPRLIAKTASQGRKKTNIYQALPNENTVLFAKKHTNTE